MKVRDHILRIIDQRVREPVESANDLSIPEKPVGLYGIRRPGDLLFDRPELPFESIFLPYPLQLQENILNRPGIRDESAEPKVERDADPDPAVDGPVEKTSHETI